jgi:hypothetical protein
VPDNVDLYAGIEDVKIFSYNGDIVFFGTEQDLKSKKMRMAMGKYPTDDSTHQLSSKIIESPNNEVTEKNWCYLEHNGNLKIVYKWFPLTIGSINGNSLNLEHKETSVPDFFKYLRGSSNGFMINNEIWFMTHMVEHCSPRQYYHCIIIIDAKTLLYKRHSILFKFDYSMIEFCLGMIIEEERMIFGYSRMDRDTIVAAYERPSIDQVIFPKN